MLNNVISTRGARYMTADAANFYLATPMERKEYLRIAVELIIQEFMDLYGLHDKVKNGYLRILTVKLYAICMDCHRQEFWQTSYLRKD